MKLIHCADLHIGSPMDASFPAEKARERRAELLNQFKKLVETAAKNGVTALLIAGDLFDSDRVSKYDRTYVLDQIRANESLCFFYLEGNHDGNALREEEIPSNLYRFGDTWTSFDLGNGVVVTGSNRPDAGTLSLSPDRINLVLLHGQECAGTGNDGGDLIHVGNYKNKNIDYLALGHIHEYRRAELPPRGTVCYSGCLEGRGFDECGSKGYVLLEITGMQRVESRFVPFSARVFHAVEVDVEGIESQTDLEQEVLKKTETIPPKDPVKVTLTGYAPAGLIKNKEHLAAVLNDRFYFAKVSDESRPDVRGRDLSADVSLRGEFLRLVAESELSDEEKDRVITCGLQALEGEVTF